MNPVHGAAIVDKITESSKQNASPRLNEHDMDIESLKYKSINLEQGWIVKSDSASSDKIK